jgi:hypothetical protein
LPKQTLHVSPLGADQASVTPRADNQHHGSGISAGVNVLALQRMLGHTSAKVTLDTYADLFDDLDAVAVTLHSWYSQGITPGHPKSVLKMCSPGADETR